MLVSILSLLSGALSAVLLLSLYSKSKQQNSYMKNDSTFYRNTADELPRHGTRDLPTTAENLKAREQFQDDKFGIFLHWGTLLNDGYYRMDYDQQRYQL